LSSAKAWAGLHALLDNLDIADVTLLAEQAEKARQIVYDATGNKELRADIEVAYRRLETQYSTGVAVAVRSSATAEDLPTASFGGQHESYLNIHGIDDLFEACRRCFASLFTDRAIVYRVNNGFDHFKVGLSVGVMKMVRSDRASSGVIFTLDTESGFPDVVFITGVYGLGENIVQESVDPDEFYVHKPTFKQGDRAVLRRTLGRKQLRLTYAEGHTGSTTRNVPTTEDERASFCIEDSEVLKLVDQAIRIEEHYSHRAGHAEPMDIEWAKDADDGELYIVPES
jgi:pyruvate,water dikinase